MYDLCSIYAWHTCGMWLAVIEAINGNEYQSRA